MKELIWRQSESIRQLDERFHTFLGDHRACRLSPRLIRVIRRPSHRFLCTFGRLLSLMECSNCELYPTPPYFSCLFISLRTMTSSSIGGELITDWDDCDVVRFHSSLDTLLGCISLSHSFILFRKVCRTLYMDR